ncbi:ABC transporter ATP-binding protein [Pasteurellaceae bacterium Macca]|nr:ABC transporter ATP-binding protein [Pasteurellaceae bacterium Macca]
MYSSISQFGRILGSLFYEAPNTPQNQALIALFQTPEWQSACDFLPLETRQAVQAGFFVEDIEQLNEAYQGYFIGPNELPTPLWGSVYLDPESVIFGESLLQLREFLRKAQIDLTLPQNEPEDHIGLMLMLSAYLAEHHPDTLKPFFEQHFLPWAYRFFELFNSQTHAFYRSLGELTVAFLRHWQETYQFQPLVLRLYR